MHQKLPALPRPGQTAAYVLYRCPGGKTAPIDARNKQVEPGASMKQASIQPSRGSVDATPTSGTFHPSGSGLSGRPAEPGETAKQVNFTKAGGLADVRRHDRPNSRRRGDKARALAFRLRLDALMSRERKRSATRLHVGGLITSFCRRHRRRRGCRTVERRAVSLQRK